MTDESREQPVGLAHHAGVVLGFTPLHQPLHQPQIGPQLVGSIRWRDMRRTTGAGITAYGLSGPLRCLLCKHESSDLGQTQSNTGDTPQYETQLNDRNGTVQWLMRCVRTVKCSMVFDPCIDLGLVFMSVQRLLTPSVRGFTNTLSTALTSPCPTGIHK